MSLTFAEAVAALKKAGHIHISEREADGTWEDCTWDSGLEWFRLVYDTRKPATHAEAQLLRRASGEPATGGSNLGDLARGIKTRYGVSIPARISGFSALKTALTPGKVAVIQGSMKAFGSTHRLSVYDRNFDGAHALLLANVDGQLLWCDPEAPTTAAVPVKVSWTEVEQFVRAFAGQHVVGRIKNLVIPATEASVKLVTYLPGYTAKVKSGSNIRIEPRIASTKLHALTADLSVTLIGTVTGDVDPANGSNVWYAFWHENRTEYTAKDNITGIAAPAAADAYTKATQDAAVAAATAPLTAKVTDLTAKLAADAITVSRYESLKAAIKLLLS